MKTLKDIIKATSDYGYAEAQIMSEEECKKHNLPSNGRGWNGVYFGEYVRKLLREEAKKQINEWQIEFTMLCLPTCPPEVNKKAYIETKAKVEAFKYFFNLDDEE